MNLQRLLIWIVAAAVLTPILLVLVVGMGHLMAAMGDAGGALFLRRTAAVVGVLWVFDLVALLVLLAIERLTEPQE